MRRMDRIDKRNTLYYMAAVGTVLVFIVALVALSTCADTDNGPSSQQQAVLDAYQKGYLDGYSRGYSDGFATGRGTSVTQQSSVEMTTDRGCGLYTVAADMD